MLRRIFELYGTGNYSLSTLRKTLFEETRVRLSRAYLETILKNQFYLGYFLWQGIQYKGTHTPIVETTSVDRVQAVFAGHNKPKYRKHNFAFSRLLTCAHDGCTVTTELHKGKYVYYRCSFGRGKCDLPYMPEPQISDKLGDVLKNIYVPDEVVRAIVKSVQENEKRGDTQRQQQLASVNQRLSALRARMDQMYEDKLDGKIDEAFWARKMSEWRTQERALQSAADCLSQPIPANRALTAERILELANKAHFLYLTRNSAERGQLLKKVHLNCATDGVSLTPTYRKPFDLIFERAKGEEWSGREDLNFSPPGLIIPADLP